MRQTALAAAWIGALGSVAFVLYAGRDSPVRFVLGPMFVMWVAAPFVALWLAIRAAGRWSPPAVATLEVVTILVAVASLAIYAGRILFPPISQGAFVFVAVPPASVIVGAAALLTARLMDRRVKGSR